MPHRLANTAFNINSQTIQYEEQLGSEAVNTVVLRGTWAGYTVAVKKVVGERFRTSDLEALREELNPLKYDSGPLVRKAGRAEKDQRGEARCALGKDRVGVGRETA